MRDTHSMRFLRTHGTLLLLLLVGFFLRSVSPDWDNGARIHPDEALIVNGVLHLRSTGSLFPGFHDYNGFSVYLLALWSAGVATLSGNAYWSQTAEGVTITGRYLSAILSTLSLIGMYTIGKSLWSKETGLMAAFLGTFTPLLIQLSHFYTTENILLFFIPLLMTLLIRSAKHGSHISVVPAGVTLGILLATKNTAYLLYPLAILSFVFSNKNLPQLIRMSITLGTISLTAFFVFSPYSFIDFAGYAERSRYLADVVSGRLPMDWTRQFFDSTPLFWLKTLPIALGIPFAMGIFGMLYALFRRPKNGSITAMIFWSIGYMVFLAGTYLKFTRYIAPVIPMYLLFTAYVIRKIYRHRIGKVIGIGTLATQLILGVMYLSVYLSPHTSVTASEWLQQNVPSSSSILVEEWNSILRFSQVPLRDNAYRITSVNFYSPDTAEKRSLLRQHLAETEYIILESPKVKNTIMRLQDSYPDTARFYTDLASGALGFTKIAEFSSYPRLGPWKLSDEFTEETFTVFDHPTIRIYKKIHAAK